MLSIQGIRRYVKMRCCVKLFEFLNVQNLHRTAKIVSIASNCFIFFVLFEVKKKFQNILQPKCICVFRIEIEIL